MAQIGEMTVGLKFDSKGLNTSIKDVEKNVKSGYTVTKNILANLATNAIQGVINKTKELASSVVEVGMAFEQQMSKVSAISGATGDELDALNKKAREMGATTKFTATEAGQAFEYMAMAGWKTEDMLAGVEGIMSLAAASGEDLATTSDIVTDALTAFNYSAKDAGHFADVLAVAASNSNTNVAMMGETFKYVGAMAGTLGYSVEDAALGIGLMANAGIKSSQAGTELNAIFTRLSTNTNGARDAIQGLGIDFFDANGTARPFSQVLGELREKTKDLTDEQKVNLANNIAGQRAQAGLLAMLNASASDYDKLTTAIGNTDGAAKKMADTMMDNLAGSITLMKSQWEAAQLALFQGDSAGFAENFAGVMQKAGDMLVQGLPFLVDGLKAVIDGVIKVLPRLINDIGPVLIQGTIDIAMSLVDAIPDLIQMAIDILIQITDALVKNAPTILNKVVNAIINGVLTLTKPENLSKVLQGAIKLFMEIVKALPQIITALITALPDVITNIVMFLLDPENLRMIVEAAIQLFFGIVMAVPQILGALLGAFGDLVGKLWNGITGMFGKFAQNFGEFIAGIFKGAINGVITFIENFINGPIDIINGFIDTINGAFGWIGVNLGRLDRIKLPRLAEGGLATGATTAIIGEAGAEAVLPLEQNTGNWSGLLAGALAEEFENSGTNVGSGVVIENMEFKINSELDAREIGRVMMESIRRAA